MKKVWIMEKFISAEVMQKEIEDMEKILSNVDTMYANEADRQNAIDAAVKVRATIKEKLNDNPDGYWCGWEGKSDYRTFCRRAQEDMRYEHNRGERFRVGTAEINDNADTWLGYKNFTENDKVLRYLYATL